MMIEIDGEDKDVNLRNYYKKSDWDLVAKQYVQICKYTETEKCTEDCRLCNIPIYAELKSIKKHLRKEFGYLIP